MKFTRTWNFLTSDELHGRGRAQLPVTNISPPSSPLPPDSRRWASIRRRRCTYFKKSRLPNLLPQPVQKRLSQFEQTPRTESLEHRRQFFEARPLHEEVILLTAHLDHLGMGTNKKGDSIYNGADDDASGTTAVLALAHLLATGQHPKRTIIFALFGSEELGGFGNRAFPLILQYRSLRLWPTSSLR